jgi:protein required for attachment to host cells
MKTRILVASSAAAFLYATEHLHSEKLNLVKTYEHLLGRKKGSDMVSDRPGHLQTSHGARSSYETKDPKAIEAEKFAEVLCKELHKDLNARDYERLIIVAPPHFYGLLHQHLPSHLHEPLLIHVLKDYTHCKPEELLAHLREHLVD